LAIKLAGLEKLTKFPVPGGNWPREVDVDGALTCTARVSFGSLSQIEMTAALARGAAVIRDTLKKAENATVWRAK